MTLLLAAALALAGSAQALQNPDDASSVDFESRLEAAVVHLSFPGFTDVLRGDLLAAEDDEVVQRKVRRVLKAAGLREVEGSNGAEVLRSDLSVSVQNGSLSSMGRANSQRYPDAVGETDFDSIERDGSTPAGGVWTMASTSTRRQSPGEGRSACPGGTGAYGFNTYNFLTFALQVFNAVVNTVNQINNNNNNNNDNSQNSVNVNTDQVSSNSNSANAVMVIIPPAPGRRKRDLTFCSAADRHATALHSSSALTSLLEEYVLTQATVTGACKELHVCQIVRQVAASAGFQAVYWKSPSKHLLMNSAPCELLYKDCHQVHLYGNKGRL